MSQGVLHAGARIVAQDRVAKRPAKHNSGRRRAGSVLHAVSSGETANFLPSLSRLTTLSATLASIKHDPKKSADAEQTISAFKIQFHPERTMNTLRRMFVISLAAVGAFATSAFAADANATGTWNMTVESPMGTGNPVFVLKQTGADVTGTYKGQLGEAEVKGTVKGNALELKYNIDAQGTALTITYAGTVEGDTIKGKVSYGDMGEGTFSGKKG
jgi:hypothetical protein